MPSKTSDHKQSMASPRRARGRATTRIVQAARPYLPFSEAAAPNHVHELPEFVVQALKLPSTVKLMRMGVHGEGSCAFHSMCAALNVEDYVHRSPSDQKNIAYAFRCRFKDTFDKQTFHAIKSTIKSDYNKSYESVSEGLCDPHAWADEVTIKHASKTLQANILFLDIAGNKFYCGVHDSAVLRAVNADSSATQSVPTIIVHWCNHSHFEPIGRILKSGPQTTDIQLVFRPSEREEDAALVNALMKTYARECRTRE